MPEKELERFLLKSIKLIEGYMREDIIVFGTGRYYNFKKATIQKKYSIVGFIDNAIQPDYPQKSYYNGIMVYSPYDISKLPSAKIMLCSVRFFDMIKQLKQLNIDDNRFLFGINEKPDYDNAEKCLHIAGYKVYYSNNSFVFKNTSETKKISNENDFKTFLRDLYSASYKEIQIINNFPKIPLSRRFGAEHGTPVDRYYIEAFLKKNAKYITGNVAEIADDRYTKCFGNKYISNILHVKGWGGGLLNLETGEGAKDNSFDCFICTQTLFCIYNVKSAIENIYKILKNNGYGLITVPGICYISSYDAVNWGDYWRFNKYSLHNLLCESFSEKNIHIETYGNMKTVIAELYGLTMEDLSQDDLNFYDEQFPLVICALCKKD